jgi:hypothetical protein
MFHVVTPLLLVQFATLRIRRFAGKAFAEDVCQLGTETRTEQNKRVSSTTY